MLPEFLSLKSLKPGSSKEAAGKAVAFLVTDATKLTASAKDYDKLSGGLLSKAISAGKFEGKSGQVVSTLVGDDAGVERVLVVGLGDTKDINELSYEHAAGNLVAKANADGIAELVIAVDDAPGKDINKEAAAARLALGGALKSYRFDKYHTTEAKDKKPTLKKLAIATDDEKKAAKAFEPLNALLEGSILTRNVVSEPANIIHPESLADVCRDLAQYGLEVEVLGEKEMQQLGMGSLLSVGHGSRRESQLVVMRWNGADAKTKPVAFVGKGVTFDTGGISLKPAGGMEDMKWDMGGSGTVIGLMKTIALRKAKANVVGVVGLVENMPDGQATRPGDVVTSMSGQTIEVLNTDAEGRLVLADALWYTQDRFQPQFMIDLATLTGAIVVSLGTSRAGVFSNNDELVERLFDLGEETGDEVWRLPLADVYDKQIDSPIADMQNIGADREAGSITAAQFLQRFVNDVPWVHIDIAGTAWSKKDRPTTPKGATAFGVRLLNELVAKHYEK